MGVLANDTDADGDPLTATLVTDVTNGTLVLDPDGSFTYTPGAGYVGSDSFTYEVSDDVNAVDTATVTIEVLDPDVNAPPVAVDDTYDTRPGTPLDIDPATGVLTNDTDPDGDTITVIAFSIPANGTAAMFADGSFTYTPDAGFTGTDTFIYTISDGFGATDQATVTIEVRPNEPPELTDDAYVTLQDSTLTVPAPGVLGNDTDPDGDTLTVTASTPAVLGTLATLPDGGFTYTPDPGEVGTETITISVFDGFDTVTSTLTIEILPRVAITVPPDITVPNDPGLAGAAVTYPAPTSVGGAPPVTIACTAASGAFFPLGTTTVTCTATDSTPDDDADSFTITVVDVEPPTIADRPDISVTSASSTPVSFTPPDASDNSGVPPVVVCAPASGSTFPLGITTVTCTATDGAGNTASSAFTVTVTPPVGDQPPAQPPAQPPSQPPAQPPVQPPVGDPTPFATPTPPPSGLPPVITPPLDGQLPETGGGSPLLLRIGAVVLLLGAAIVLTLRVSATASQRRRRLT
jgi:large repetitive protein